jgi:hypothetical protein
MMEELSFLACMDESYFDTMSTNNKLWNPEIMEISQEHLL